MGDIKMPISTTREEFMKKLRQSIREMREGKLIPLEDAKKEL